MTHLINLKKIIERNNNALLLPLFVCIFLGNFLTWRNLGINRLGMDDAHIYFTYAQNFIRGNGLTYSHGIEKVEGFSSPLWMSIVLLSFLLRMNEIGVFLFCLVCQASCLFIIKKIFTQLKLPNSGFLILLFSLLFFPGWWIWTGLSLMETGLTSLWILLLIYLLTSSSTREIQYFLVLAFACWVRPELLLLVVGYFFVQLYSFRRIKGRITRDLTYFFTGTLCLIVLRYVTYGYFLPNTYYAKVPTDLSYRLINGTRYLFDANQFYTPILKNVVIPILISYSSLFLIFMKIKKKNWHNSWRPKKSKGSHSKSVKAIEHNDTREIFLFSCIFMISTWNLSIVQSGGDHFELGRLFQPILLPNLCLVVVLFFILIQKFVKTSVFTILGTYVILAFLLLSMATFSKSHFVLHEKFKEASSLVSGEFSIKAMEKDYRLLAKFFLDKGQPLPRIGVIAAGVAGRSYQGEIIDMMGLNYGPIAHNGGNREGWHGHSAFEERDFPTLGVEAILASSPQEFRYVLGTFFVSDYVTKSMVFGDLCYEGTCVSGFFTKTILKRIPKELFVETYKWQSELGYWKQYEN